MIHNACSSLLGILPFAVTIFTAAFLLLQVQPLIIKYILARFAGGPTVWTTCALFFQVGWLRIRAPEHPPAELPPPGRPARRASASRPCPDTELLRRSRRAAALSRLAR